MGLAERKAAALARIASAKTALSDSDRAELSELREIESLESDAEIAEQENVDLDVARRIAIAKAAGFENVMWVHPETFTDSFIVFRNARAHAQWLQATKNRASGQKMDQTVTDRRYAISCVFDWNGKQLGDGTVEGTELTPKLEKFLIENTGLVVPITDAAAKLAGVFAETRKS